MKTALLLLLGTAIGATLAWMVLRPGTTCFEARYTDAVVYAGATDFVFELKSGERFRLRNSHDSKPIPGSAPLLGRAQDGPAEPASARLGRMHLLCVAKDGITIHLEALPASIGSPSPG
jgi:hypothetical protein